VDHSIFRAFNKGALGIINVEGPEDLEIFSGKQSDLVYLPEGGAVQTVPGHEQKLAVASSKAEQITFGQRVYESNCLACHQPGGAGIPRAFPPLAESDYLNEDHDRAIDIVLHGMTGKVTVNGQEYNSAMPAMALPNEQIANVLTYLLNNWGNKGGVVTAEQVEKRRQSGSNLNTGNGS
jgi:nitrite reductase (NO-forming)